jgi:hypothetical protein
MLPGAAAGNCSRCKEVQVIESWRSNYVNLSLFLPLVDVHLSRHLQM